MRRKSNGKQPVDYSTWKWTNKPTNNTQANEKQSNEKKEFTFFLVGRYTKKWILHLRKEWNICAGKKLKNRYGGWPNANYIAAYYLLLECLCLSRACVFSSQTPNERSNDMFWSFANVGFLWCEIAFYESYAITVIALCRCDS